MIFFKEVSYFKNLKKNLIRDSCFINDFYKSAFSKIIGSILIVNSTVLLIKT